MVDTTERVLGRIEQQLTVLPDHARMLGQVNDRMGMLERTTAARHVENRDLLEYLKATASETAEKVKAHAKRLSALEEPGLRAAEARVAWRKRRKKIASWILSAFGVAAVLGEPIYKAVAEPIARAIASNFGGGWLK